MRERHTLRIMREAGHASKGQETQTTRNLSGLPLCALCILLLVFAVVGWGLHDKLSLYAPAGAHAPVAKAKLLTERERPAAQVELPAPQLPSSIAPVSFLLFAAFLRMLLVPGLRALGGEPLFPEASQAPPLCEALRRRPPPAAVLTLAGAAFKVCPALA